MAKRKGMTETELAAICDGQITDAVAYEGSELSALREKALAYYNGDLPDVPAQEGKSSVTSHDVSDTIGWILPSLMRVFLASDHVGIYEPQKPQDEPFAKQATDYVNFVLMRECDGYKVLRSGFHEGLLTGNGIIKHWWDSEPCYETQDFTGLDDLTFQLLVAPDDVEVLEHTETTTELGTLHDCRIKVKVSSGKMKIRGVPGEDFGMGRAAIALNEDDCDFCFHRDAVSRSDLKARGYDPEIVDELPAYVDRSSAQSEKDAREPLRLLGSNQPHDVDPAAERVEIFECYVKADYDGDGVAEWRQVVMGGTSGERRILANEEWSGNLPFTDLVPDPIPHRWRGRSVFDEVSDVQRVKTVLMRKMLDSLYGAVESNRAMDFTRVKNMDVALDLKAGDVILTEGDPNSIIRDLAMPFVGKEVGPVIEYMDRVAERRTGVGNQSAGLDMEALQNQTATATNAMQAAAYGKKEDYARNLAEMGMRRFFRCLLKLFVANQDRPRTIRLRDEWVEMDPRVWNADMDVSINTGLGSGSRDRDLQMLAGIKASQEQILMQMGPMNPLVTIDQYANTLHKMVEAAGLKAPELFFKKPSPEELQAFAQQSGEKPDPKVQEAMAKVQIEQQKAQAEHQRKMQQDAAEDVRQKQRMAVELQHMREKAALEHELALEKQAKDALLKEREMAQNFELRIREMEYEAQLTAEANRMKAAAMTQVPVDTNIERAT